ncbi:hypothetical protein NGTWS0302_16640 [Mycolicibacterium cyprinidarum]|uniref:Uncharacterized protein n=1 Tax=Mycolicibacterium cyprinidarum TaxID=2860311 RepID=A0ABQ4V4G0_9MYCO|nr:hypothetical protein NGTWS1702_34280 [Mycolicibacterium sp. NGTWSNA01]GJF18449.1 hypothetical protein NGTWS0302_16640 [Mycolicibacterium sp. NGTWS0302]
MPRKKLHPQKPPWPRGREAYHVKMNIVRFRYLMVCGVLAATAIVGAPTALAQPGNPADCVASPENSACAMTPGSPGAPTSPNDLRCISQPGDGVCAGGPYGVPGSTPGMPGGPGMPGMPGMPGGMGGMGGMGGAGGMGGF